MDIFTKQGLYKYDVFTPKLTGANKLMLLLWSYK